MFGVCQIDSKISGTQAVFTFKAAQKTRSLTFDLDGTWTSAVGDNRTVWNPASGVAFQFLLERSYDDLLKLFAAAEEVLGPDRLSSSFPFDGIVMVALNDSGEYWMDLAIKWMEHPAFRFTTAIANRISELAFRQTRNQKLQHRFRRIYAQLKNSGLVSDPNKT